MASGRPEAPVDGEERPKKRRLPGVNLRPGAVKQARLEAELSLAQLGKGHVTAPAIYLIETGRTRPSLPTLEHIARRTGKPVEFFLAEPGGGVDDSTLRLLELEVLVAAGRHGEALVAGEALLEGGGPAFRLGRIRFLLGQACLGAGQPERAASLLEEARGHFEAVNDVAMLAECLGVQASTAVAAQSREAVGLAEKALAACRSLVPVPAPAEARLLGVLGSALAAAQEWDRAVAAFEAAIELGAGVLDLAGAARMYADLGTAYRQAGEADSAARHLARAMGLFDLMRDRAALVRAETNLALVFLQRRDLEGARAHLDRSLELSRRAETETARGRVLLGQCELAMLEGDASRAHDLAVEALELAQRTEDSATAAETHVWLGRIADMRGDHVEADREFERAIQGFAAMGKRERLLQSHGAYAEILERRGELARAYTHMKEALQASRPGLLRTSAQEEERVTSA